MNEKGPTSTHARYQQLLVEAARTDAPPAGARERLLASVGISASAGLAGAKAAAATGVGATSSAAVLLKALVWGTIAGGVGMGIAHSWPDRVAKRTADPGRSAVSTITATAVASATPLQPSVVTPRTDEPEKKAIAPKIPSSSSPPVPESSEIALERQLLDDARKAVAAGRASSGIKSLNEYQERFGFGLLGHEATVLRMEALLALGRREDATALGRRYLAEHPHGAQVAAVRRLLGSSEASPGPAPAASDQKSDPRQ